MADCELGNLRQEICDLKTALANLVLNAAHPPAHLTYVGSGFSWDDETQQGNIPVVAIPATPDPEVVVVADPTERGTTAPQKLNQLLIQTTDAANGNFSVWSAIGLFAGNWTLKTGSLASQNANAVSITGGSVSGIVPIAIADGGTASSTAAAARQNLALASAMPDSSVIDWLDSDNQFDNPFTDVVYTFDNEADGLKIDIAINMGSGFTITWPSNVKWVGGTPPTPSGVALTDVYTFKRINGNTFGSVVLGYDMT